MSEFIPTEARQHYERARRDNRASSGPQQTEPNDLSRADITCIKCSQVNAGEHRYCRACGLSLWKPCPGCATERPIDELFCVRCGQNLADYERQLVQEHCAQLAQVEQLVSALQLHEAVSALRAIVSAAEHPCLEEVRTAATAMLDQVTARRDELSQAFAIRAQRGRQLLDAFQYEEARRELEFIPASLRDEHTNKMLEEAVSRLQEIAQLRQLLEAPTGGSIERRMVSLERLLTLLPHNDQVSRWAMQARDEGMHMAQKMLQQHQYARAVDLLTRVPAPVVDATISTLLKQASELEYLWSEVELAPHVTATTLQAAERLAKADRTNNIARDKLQEMRRRLQAGKSTALAPAPDWAPCPPQTRVGMPVLSYVAPRHVGMAGPEVRRALVQEPGRYFVACGLALQAISKTTVKTNLLPVRNTGVLGILRTSLRERPATTGWGLDLSTSGLKAVRIATDAHGQPAITHSEFLPHRLPLSHPEATPIRKALLLETLAKFTESHATGSGERVGVSWPAVQTLVRFLQLPPVDGKKRRDMLEREIRQQIPMPLDLVAHDTFTFPGPQDATKHEQVRSLLVAARRSDLEAHVSTFQQAGIDVHVIQCDAVALHNFFQHDRPANAAAQGPAPKCARVAILDVGAETTNVLFSAHDSLWFRSVRPAGDDIVSALVQRFKLTREVAAALARNPAKSARMSDVHQQLCVVFQKLVGQIEGCVHEYRKNVAPDGVEELLVVGGAGATPGLLRFLRFGR